MGLILVLLCSLSFQTFKISLPNNVFVFSVFLLLFSTVVPKHLKNTGFTKGNSSGPVVSTAMVGFKSPEWLLGVCLSSLRHLLKPLGFKPLFLNFLKITVF